MAGLREDGFFSDAEKESADRLVATGLSRDDALARVWSDRGGRTRLALIEAGIDPDDPSPYFTDSAPEEYVPDTVPAASIDEAFEGDPDDEVPFVAEPDDESIFVEPADEAPTRKGRR